MRRFLLAPIFLVAALARAAPIEVTILHTNDLHAHVEPVSIQGKSYGGYARQATLIERFRATDPNPIVLSGGDTFQGTLYFRTYEGLADVFFMNLMGYQAMAVGNHELDRGPELLARFIAEARFPVLACNLDVSGEPSLAGKIKPIAIVQVAGERIGLIGATTPNLPSISSPGPNVKMLELVPAVTSAAADLSSQGVEKVILLSHLGFESEREVATRVPQVDVIVGGHSHTLLGSGFPAGFPQPAADYPLAVRHGDGSRTLLLSSWEWGKVLGRIRVKFDASGRVESWSEARPIVVDDTVAEHPLAASAVAALRKPIEAFYAQVVGTLGGLADRADSQRENALGNLIADAMLDATQDRGAVAAFVNAGGLRASLGPGEITYAELAETLPFGHRLVVLEVTGQELLAALEHGAGAGGGFLHPSHGFAYTVDADEPPGRRWPRPSMGRR